MALGSRRKAGRRLRIVLVEPSLDDNGAIRVSLDRARRWQEAGAEVTVFVVEHGRSPDQVPIPPGLQVRYATSVPRRFRWTVLIGGPRLVRLVRAADVVVGGREIHMGLLFAARAAALGRRPLAVTVQSRPDIVLTEYLDDGLRDATRRALTGADLAVCVAEGLIAPLEALGLPPGRARAVTNGIDVDEIREAAGAQAAVALPELPFVVACGRLHRQKGLDVLVRAHAAALRDGAPPHAVVIMGDGPDRAQLAQLADDLGVAASVVLTGFLENPHAVVARAALFALPSRWEGYPLALAEALCVGTPVVAADCVSGPREILDGERYGRLVPVEDEAALARAITDHLQNPAVLRERAAAGGRAAHSRFDPGVAASRHLELLRELAHHRVEQAPSRVQRHSSQVQRSSS